MRGGRDFLESSEIAVVLVEPQEPGNIGAAARAMANMGLRRLVLVRPVNHLVPAAFRMALLGRSILERAEVHDGLAAALEPFGFVAGTTRRKGKARQGMVDARAAAAELTRKSRCNSCAVVFGREDSGLTNSELELCHRFITIPSSPRCQSLNLAQAVLVMAYELFLARSMGTAEPVPSAKRLAPHATVEEMFLHAERVLLAIGYLHTNNPKRMMRALRNIFARAGLDEREVRAVRGIFRQVEWYCRQARTGSFPGEDGFC